MNSAFELCEERKRGFGNPCLQIDKDPVYIEVEGHLDRLLIGVDKGFDQFLIIVRILYA